MDSNITTTKHTHPVPNTTEPKAQPVKSYTHPVGIDIVNKIRLNQEVKTKVTKMKALGEEPTTPQPIHPQPHKLSPEYPDYPQSMIHLKIIMEGGFEDQLPGESTDDFVIKNLKLYLKKLRPTMVDNDHICSILEHAVLEEVKHADKIPFYRATQGDWAAIHILHTELANMLNINTAPEGSFLRPLSVMSSEYTSIRSIQDLTQHISTMRSRYDKAHTLGLAEKPPHILFTYAHTALLHLTCLNYYLFGNHAKKGSDTFKLFTEPQDTRKKSKDESLQSYIEQAFLALGLSREHINQRIPRYIEIIRQLEDLTGNALTVLFLNPQSADRISYATDSSGGNHELTTSRLRHERMQALDMNTPIKLSSAADDNIIDESNPILRPGLFGVSETQTRMMIDNQENTQSVINQYYQKPHSPQEREKLTEALRALIKEDLALYFDSKQDILPGTFSQGPSTPSQKLANNAMDKSSEGQFINKEQLESLVGDLNKIHYYDDPALLANIINATDIPLTDDTKSFLIDFAIKSEFWSTNEENCGQQLLNAVILKLGSIEEMRLVFKPDYFITVLNHIFVHNNNTSFTKDKLAKIAQVTNNILTNFDLVTPELARRLLSNANTLKAINLIKRLNGCSSFIQKLVTAIDDMDFDQWKKDLTQLIGSNDSLIDVITEIETLLGHEAQSAVVSALVEEVLESKDPKQTSDLWILATQRNESVCHLIRKNLVNQSENIDIILDCGKTPLQLALQRGLVSFCQTLIEKGAQLKTNDNGKNLEHFHNLLRSNPKNKKLIEIWKTQTNVFERLHFNILF